MTGAELISEVQSIIDDSSFDEETILDLLNDGLSMAAARVDIPGLAELDTVSTSTSADNVSLPSTYMRKLEGCYSVTNERTISGPGEMYDYLKFKRKYPSATSGSRVEALAVRGESLFYYPTPTTQEELQLSYYRKPDTLTESSSPDIIPEHLQKRLLCAYAAGQIFNKIEDGIEGQKINTENNRNVSMEALAELMAIFPTDAEAVYVSDVYGW